MQVRSFKQQALAFAVAAAFPPTLLSQTLPSGFGLGAGQATPSYSPGHLQIEQASHKAILNWESFSIGAGGTVNFNQHQGSSSVALNRVLGNNPSQIFGNLSANGRVFLVNPSGILFGPGSQVSVGGLVASTLSITDDDFLAGRYTFSNAGGAGSILNQGNLFSHSGYTALLAPQVTNEGFIFANLGSVALAAGDRVSLDMVGDNLIRVNVDQATLDAAVVNRGSIEAFGGNVLLTAHSANAVLDTVLNTEGIVRAFGMTEQDGQIVLHGGSRGTTALGGEVFSGGAMTIGGDAVVVAAGGGRNASVSSSAGQTVNAHSLEVSAHDGNFATLSSRGGDQTITVTGGGASSGIDVTASGGGFAGISQDDAAFVQRISVIDADHINVNGISGGAGIFAINGTQSISITGSGANAITLGSTGAQGPSNIGGGVVQSITAGLPGQEGAIQIVGAAARNALAGFVSNPSIGGTQTVATSGRLSVTGGSAQSQDPNFPAGIFHNGSGPQAITAASIDIRAGATGSGNGAFVNSNGGGDQFVTMTGGSITVAAGEGGSGNGASLGSARGRNQTITGRPDIFISGGATSNATITAGTGALQDIQARNIFLTNGENSPGNSAGVILGSHQLIDASGDVTLVARSGTGTSSGVRIGAQGAGATDLELRVGNNLLLRGGTSGTNGAGLGGSGTTPTDRNDITVVATGDVILDGAVGGGGVRIGSSALTPVQEGNISVTGRNIVFTGARPSAIRTLGDVELHADQFDGTISQGANGFILADGLTTTAYGSTTLAGANQVSRYSGGSWFGEMTLNNSGPLEVSSLSASNATLTNAGPVHISGPWSTFGNTAIATTGTGSSLLITDTVFANGEMNVDVSGDFTVRGSGVLPMSVASSGNQTINVTGGSLDLEGAFTQIASHGGNQTVTVHDGDHIRIVSENGAFTGMSAAGTQTISITGSGRNAMEFGSAGGTGSIFVSAPALRLTAGVGSESGSITITGPDAPDTSVQIGAGFPFAMPGEQTISTTGALTVIGGSRPGGSFVVTGIVHNGFGPQTISAGSLELRGGAAGSGNAATISSLGGGEQRIDVAGDLVLLGGPGGLASLFSSASQAISAANVRLQGAFAGANGGAFVNAFGQNIDVSGDITVAGGSGTNNGAGIHSSAALQSISASNLRVQGAFGGANSGAFVNAAAQDIDVSGDITVAGGSGTSNGAGIHSLAALQSISASNLRLQGALAGENSGAFVNGMGQHIDVSGEIVIAGGSGTNNGGGINSTGMQTVLGRPDITVTSGVSNFATINAGPGALQTIEAHDIRVSNSTGLGNSAGVIQGTHQQIDATGDVTLTAHAATGDLAGARIGGATGSSTDLHLRLDGNLVLTGGSAGQNGASLGGSVTGAALANDIVVRAGGNVILDGASGGAGVRIGTSPRIGIAGGNIDIEAANIRILGEAPAAIRTLGNVELRAEQPGGTITQDANGFILANALTTTSSGSTSLAGENQVSSFNGTSWFGDVALNNAGALEVMGVSAVNASLTNEGPVTLSGWWNSLGDTSIATSGAGSDLLVTNSVFAGGVMNVEVVGGSVDITSSGGNVQLTSFAGDQRISVRDGDHIRIQAPGGGDLFMFASDGKQTLEIEGIGRNAIEIGSVGGLGGVVLFSKTQTLLAGRAGESGSITLIGPDADGKAVLVQAPSFDGIPSAQSISTSGTLKVVGGARTGGIPLLNGFLQFGEGSQTVNADRIEVHSGPGGAGNVAWISSVTGDQHITVAGDIEVLAGPGGEAALQVSSSPQLPPRPGVQTVSARNVAVRGGQAGTNANAFLGGNAAGGQFISLTGDLTVVGGPGGRASVFSAGPQTIDAANIRVVAGLGNGASIGSGAGYPQTIVASGDIEIAGGVSSNASISAPGAGALQSISARNITLSNGIDSPGNSAGVILGAHQVIDASGDVTLTAHSGTGTSSGVRIGASGSGATDLLLTVDGNILLTGGTTGTNGAGLGGAGSGPTSDNNIVVIAGGDVVLDGAVGGAGARIGSSALTPVQDGDVSITARNIRFTGTAPAAIRTTGNVELHAISIEQGANGLMLANALTTSSAGSTLLGGSNNVSSFTASAGGDLLLRNLSAFLTLGPVDASGALSIDQAGSLLIHAGEAPLVVRGGAVNMVTGGDLRLLGGTGYQARAELVSGGDIDATIGGVVTLDKGLGEESWARIRSESADGVMRFTFPNLTSGGFYVDGVEGDIKHGLTGFFILNKPVKIGETLILDYQE